MKELIVKEEDAGKVRDEINLQRLGDENILNVYDLQETICLDSNSIKFNIFIDFADGK